MTFEPRSGEQLLALTVNAGLPELATHPRFASASQDLVEEHGCRLLEVQGPGDRRQRDIGQVGVERVEK